MTTQYTLKLINNWKDADFHFFGQAPTATTLNTNVWYSATIPFCGSEEIQTNYTNYVWCGSVVGGSIQGISEPLTLGTVSAPGSIWKTTSVNGTTLEFIDAVPNTAPLEAFQIQTGSDFSANDDFMVGLAWVDPSDSTNIVPVATFLVAPNTTYTIVPKPVFYVAVIGTTGVPLGVWDFHDSLELRSAYHST